MVSRNEPKFGGRHWGDMEIQQLVISFYYDIQDGRHQFGDLELLKWFRLDIQDGHHGSHLENCQITFAPER